MLGASTHRGIEADVVTFGPDKSTNRKVLPTKVKTKRCSFVYR